MLGHDAARHCTAQRRAGSAPSPIQNNSNVDVDLIAQKVAGKIN